MSVAILRWTLMIGAVCSLPLAAMGECLPDAMQASGAEYRICMPEGDRWNGNLVIYCHGFVSPYEAVEVSEDTLTGPDGRSLADIFVELGYAFAVTSYSANGLAIREGLADVVDLRGLFAEGMGEPVNTYLLGFSMGSLIATQAAEQHPELFQGCVAACGPIGDFTMQIDWFGDFRVAFDYFFSPLFPGSPVNIPEFIAGNPLAYYLIFVRPFITAPQNEGKLRELVAVAGLPVDEERFVQTAEEAVVSLFFFNGAAPNDTIRKLGGQPYDNAGVRYTGTSNDLRYNALVERFRADAAAQTEIAAHYETSGQIAIPYVLIHTEGDQVVPFAHAPMYVEKVAAAGGGGEGLTFIPVDRLGHCNFRTTEVLVAFSRAVYLVEGADECLALGRQITDPAMTTAQERSNFFVMAERYDVPVDRNVAIALPPFSSLWALLLGIIMQWLALLF